MGDLTAIGAETEAGRGPTESCSLTEVDRATGAVGPETVAAQVAKPEVVRSEDTLADIGVVRLNSQKAEVDKQSKVATEMMSSKTKSVETRNHV